MIRRDVGTQRRHRGGRALATLLLAAVLVPMTAGIAAPVAQPPLPVALQRANLGDLSARLLPAVVNISSTQITKAAAPSDTSEQSVRLSGGAT